MCVLIDTALYFRFDSLCQFCFWKTDLSKVGCWCTYYSSAITVHVLILYSLVFQDRIDFIQMLLNAEFDTTKSELIHKGIGMAGSSNGSTEGRIQSTYIYIYNLDSNGGRTCDLMLWISLAFQCWASLIIIFELHI